MSNPLKTERAPAPGCGTEPGWELWDDPAEEPEGVGTRDEMAALHRRMRESHAVTDGAYLMDPRGYEWRWIEHLNEWQDSTL